MRKLTKVQIKLFKDVVLKANGKVFSIRLATDPCDFLALKEIMYSMLLIWKTKFFVKDSVLKKYPLGILRRFLISYDSETETYSPYFYIICVCPNDLKTETFKTNVLLKWYATWIKTFGYYEDAKIKYSLINELKSEEEIEAELEKFGSLADYDFCDADSLFNIQDWLAQRNLFSATGIFREALNLNGKKQRHFYDPYREPAKKPTPKIP